MDSNLFCFCVIHEGKKFVILQKNYHNIKDLLKFVVCNYMNDITIKRFYNISYWSLDTLPIDIFDIEYYYNALINFIDSNINKSFDHLECLSVKSIVHPLFSNKNLNLNWIGYYNLYHCENCKYLLFKNIFNNGSISITPYEKSINDHWKNHNDYKNIPIRLGSHGHIFFDLEKERKDVTNIIGNYHISRKDYIDCIITTHN